MNIAKGKSESSRRVGSILMHFCRLVDGLDFHYLRSYHRLTKTRACSSVG